MSPAAIGNAPCASWDEETTNCHSGAKTPLFAGLRYNVQEGRPQGLDLTLSPDAGAAVMSAAAST